MKRLSAFLCQNLKLLDIQYPWCQARATFVCCHQMQLIGDCSAPLSRKLLLRKNNLSIRADLDDKRAQFCSQLL